MSSLSATVGQYAASSPIVGIAVNNASAGAALLGSLSNGTTGGPFDNVISALEAAPTSIANQLASIGASSNSTVTASAATAAADTTSAATGVGQNVDTLA